jgi:hypothetical protein
MQRSRWLAGLVSSVGMLAATAAVAEPRPHPFDGIDTAPRYMLYVQHAFGGGAQASFAPRLGFSIDRELPVALDRMAMRSSVRLIDVQFSSATWNDVWLNGYKVAGEREYSLRYDGSYNSYGEGSWGNPWLWGGATLAALFGISCATDNWPCEESERRRPSQSGYQIPGT